MRALKLRAVHEGRKLKDVAADLLKRGLAAFAILHGMEFVTLDRDFRNFEKDGLKLRCLAECAP